MVTFDIGSFFKKPVSFLAFSRDKLLLVEILRILVVIAEIYVCSIFFRFPKEFIPRIHTKQSGPLVLCTLLIM